MKFLRIMGLCFLIAGAASAYLDPKLRVMGICWIVTGIILVGAVQLSARAAAHRQLLLQTGKAGRATILEVKDTGITVNNSPRARIKVRIVVPGEAPIEAKTGMFVSRVGAPRPGETYDVRFDPKNPNDFVFEERRSTPHSGSDDRISQLERLGELRDKGVLTEAEFQAEKIKLLGKT